MKRFLYLFILLNISNNDRLSAASMTVQNPITLQAKIPTSLNQVPDYKAAHLQQINYFFDHLPQAPLPQSIINEIEKTYRPLLTVLSPIDNTQTQPERQAQVMDHIKRFYGLLYLIAQAELYQQNSATTGSGKNTTLATGDTLSNTNNLPVKELTPKQLISSGIWQDHLKIMIASSFQEEVQLLTTVHQHELKMFQYLPAFETAYYQPAVTHLRKASELTRMYLLLVDRMRKRFLTKINTDSSWGTLITQINTLEESLKKGTAQEKISLSETLKTIKNNLYQEISSFQNSPFYSIVMQFQNIEWTNKYPVQFTDPQGNALSLMQAVTNNYDFSNYFTFDTTTKTIEINPTFSLCLTIEPSSNGQQELYLTGLGNYFFTGNATTRITQTTAGDSLVIGTLELTQKSAANPNQLTLDQFFAQKPITTIIKGVTVTSQQTEATLGFYELLCFMAMKSLHADLSDLFIKQNLSISLSQLAQQPFILPNFMEKWPQDYLILNTINTIQDFFTAQGIQSSQDTLTPQGFFHSFCHFFSHDIVGGLESLASSFYHHLPGRIQNALIGIKNALKTGFTETVEESWDAIKDVGDSAWHALKAAGDEAVSLYYASCILPLTTYALSAGHAGTDNMGQALRESEEWQKGATAQVTAATNDLTKAITDVAQAATAIQNVEGSIITSVIGVADKQLGNDIAGMMNTTTDMFINLVKDSANAVFVVQNDLLKLGAQSVQILSSILGGVLTGGIFSKEGIDAIGDDIKATAESTAASFLSCITFFVNAFAQELQSAMITIAYVTAAATQTVIDVMNVIAAAIVFGFTGEWHYNEYRTALESQSRLISGIVTLAAVVAITVITGGAAAPFAIAMLAMSAPMMVMSIIGDAQQDSNALNKKAYEKQFTQDFKEYVINSATVIEGVNTQNIIEQLVQLQAESMNHERALLYSQNYLNDLFAQTVSQSAFGYGMSIFQKLGINNTTRVIQADLGSLYGINTGRLNLNTVGNELALYNDGRQTFSQEIAAEPFMLTKPSSLFSDNPEIETFWFRQKDLTNFTKNQPLHADILWKSIYEYDDQFYIGIYLTERYFDTAAIQNAYNNFIQIINPQSGNTNSNDFDNSWSKLDTINRYLVDYDHLAKMFVCSPSITGKSSKNNNPQLGVYIHEAPETLATNNGWLNNTFEPITFTRGVWYRMQATLDGSTLTTRFWQVGTDQDAKNALPTDTPPATAITEVFTNIPEAQVPEAVASLNTQSNYAGSMGVIASGASIEYIILSPAPSFTKSAARQQSDSSITEQSTLEHNKNWYQNLTTQMNPPAFGKFKFKPADQDTILQQQYIYSTQGTFNTATTDYVVFVASITPTGKQVGISPKINSTPTAIMSLVSGELYNSAGQVVGQVVNPIQLYQQTNGKIPQSIVSQLAPLRKQYWQNMTGPFNFENMKLTGLLPAMANGIFIYSAQQTGYTDYLMCASSNDTGITNSNIPLFYSSAPTTITSLISLVTGTIYTLQNASGSALTTLTQETIGNYQIISSNNTYNNVYSQYQQQLPTAIQKEIMAAQKRYQTQTANSAADTALQQTAQTALNNLNTAISNGQGQSSFTSGTYLTAINTTQSAAQSALSSLQNNLTTLTTAMKNSSVATTDTIYTNLQASITAANNAATQLNNAVTAAQNAPSTTTTSYGSSSTSGYGASSSYGNFNTSYSNYGDYGSNSYNEYGNYNSSY